MGDPDKKICRYFNTQGGCWYNETCKFLHITDKTPPCKFFWDKSSTGCRFGDTCHFSHDSASLKSIENRNDRPCSPKSTTEDSNNTSGRNNNNMTASSRLVITDPPMVLEKLKEKDAIFKVADADGNIEETISATTDMPPNEPEDEETKDDKGIMQRFVDMPEFTPDPNFQPEQIVAESQIMCGSCKRILERRGNESYCNLLKDHYLECFLDKEGDHVKCVKLKAALEPGQMYWCKSCILIFEKPWSLFQHMADKAKGAKVQRWEKKVHLDWIDSVAGLMAGHDLGLFSPLKLRNDLRNQLADQHTMEEEMEAAAVAAAAMVQWLAPISSPWRLHQRDMMRKIENLHRQVLRKAGGAAAIARAALAGGQVGGYAFNSQGGRYGGPRGFRATNQQFLEAVEPAGDAPMRLIIREVDEEGRPSGEIIDIESIATCSDKSASTINATHNEPTVSLPAELESTESEQHVAGASGDHPTFFVASQKPRLDLDNADKSSCPKSADVNNTNITVPCPRGDGGVTDAPVTVHDVNSNNNNEGTRLSRCFEDRASCVGVPGGILCNSNYNLGSPGSRAFDRPCSRPFSQSIRHITSPTKFDLNCGFTDDEVEELLCQGIKPWDSEAAAALAVLHGEMDHLLN